MQIYVIIYLLSNNERIFKIVNKYIREPINGLTHLAGAILSFIGLLALVIKASIINPSVISIMSVIIFGVSMILLYSASATYHMVIASDNVINFLRRLDHSMIFILIAGSYAPFCLIGLKNITGFSLFTIVSLIAIIGIIFKMIWFNCPRWVSTGIYICMGWLSIFIVKPLCTTIPLGGMILLALGGLFYTIGAIIYGFKPKCFNIKNFGFHEIFHIFILAGSLCHFLAVFIYII